MSDQWVGPFTKCHCGGTELELRGEFWRCKSCGSSYGRDAGPVANRPATNPAEHRDLIERQDLLKRLETRVTEWQKIIAALSRPTSGSEPVAFIVTQYSYTDGHPLFDRSRSLQWAPLRPHYLTETWGDDHPMWHVQPLYASPLTQEANEASDE